MSDDLLDYLLKGSAAINVGPNARELLCERLEHEYKNGNTQRSVFYQVLMLVQSFEQRYAPTVEPPVSAQELHANMNSWEQQDFQRNPLMQYVYQQLLAAEAIKTSPQTTTAHTAALKASTNFLQDVQNVAEGMRRIESVCQEMPKEWTIIQLSKGPVPETSYSIYPKIHESGAHIYLSLLRHARSSEYATPICICFAGGAEEKQLFKKLAFLSNRFKQIISSEQPLVQSREHRAKYWENIDNFEKFVTSALSELKSFLYPWVFLFTGSPAATASLYQSRAFASVDNFCEIHQWESNERMLLSLVALHISALTSLELQAICNTLSSDERQQAAAMKLLLKLQTSTVAKPTTAHKHNPCILIVDERLDHFYWEELNVEQEFSRVSSLNCLWRLHQHYKTRIRKGYLLMNILSGGCLLNPDGNLPKMEMRMKSFFMHWIPHWLVKCTEKPTVDEITQDFLKRNCFVYSGHGCGLQYIKGKNIAQQQIEAVVFLFGCDSTRLRSKGLYSEMVGAHLYYHAAMCPALIGTILPGLDLNMDTVAAAVLSHWINPKSKNIIPWNEVELTAWAKKGIIKSKTKAQLSATLEHTAFHQVGSLCEIIARVHQRRFETKLYNTIGYVCRGLPVWNCNVQAFPQ